MLRPLDARDDEEGVVTEALSFVTFEIMCAARSSRNGDSTAVALVNFRAIVSLAALPSLSKAVIPAAAGDCTCDTAALGIDLNVDASPRGVRCGVRMRTGVSTECCW